MTPGAQKGFLGNIFRLARGQTHAPQESKQGALVFADHLRKGLAVAGLDSSKDVGDVHCFFGSIVSYTNDRQKGYRP
jgi:hypothetical protein